MSVELAQSNDEAHAAPSAALPTNTLLHACVYVATSLELMDDALLPYAALSALRHPCTLPELYWRVAVLVEAAAVLHWAAW